MQRYKNTPYFVTTSGEVFREHSSKPLKLEILRKGYKRVSLCIDGIVQRLTVHRMVADVYIVNPLDKKYINHIDNNPSNNNVSNLEWCSHSENMLHCHKQGRCSNLEASKKASEVKLTDAITFFKLKLESNFVKVVSRGRRNYVSYHCFSCGKLKESRTDSSTFKNTDVKCASCIKIKVKI